MKKFLIGCAGVLFIVAIFVGVLILETPRFLDAGKKVVADLMVEEMRIAALESAWKAPSPQPDAQWFPAAIGEWKLEGTEPAKEISAIGLKRPGQAGVYRSNRGLVEVNIVPVTEEERAGLLEAALATLRERREATAAIRGGSGVDTSLTREASRVTTTRGNRTYVRIGSADHTRLWWLKDNLFVFRAYRKDDFETFPEEFLRASSASLPPPP